MYKYIFTILMKSNNTKIMETLCQHYVNELIISPASAGSLIKFWKTFHKFIDHNTRNRGAKDTVDKCKSILKQAYDLTSGLPVKPIPWMKSNRNGVVKILLPVLNLLHGNTIEIRLVMTILRSYMKITLNIDYNIGNIVNPQSTESINKVEEILPNFISFVTKFLSFQRKYDDVFRYFKGSVTKLKFPKLRLTTKTGPNGPAMLTSHLDAIALKSDESLYRIFEQWNRLTGQLTLSLYVDNLYKKCFQMNSNRTLYHSKVSFSAEAGGKTRIFAIVDYFTQCSLIGLHNDLMRKLKSISVVDATFDQDLACKGLAERKRGYASSMDLTGATDRFPVKIISAVLDLIYKHEKNFYGETIGSLWMKLMTDRKFKVSDKSGSVWCSWAVGQPLGALSSWAAFAITHHLVVQYSHYLAYNDYRSFKDYIILGDDIVIFDERVALSYYEFMISIGVEINLSKSVVDPKGNAIEFAKRRFVSSTEITGLPFPLIEYASRSIYGLHDMYRLMNKWSFNINLLNGPLLVPSYLSKKGKDLLLILIGYTALSESSERLTGFEVVRGIAIKDLETKFLEIRLQSILDKIKDLSKMIMKDNIDHKLLEEGYPGEVSGFDPMKQSVSSLASMMMGMMATPKKTDMHPIKEVYRSQGIALISLYHEINVNKHSLMYELSEIEFLPVVTVKSFYGDKKDLRSKLKSTLIISAWMKLEKQGLISASNCN